MISQQYAPSPQTSPGTCKVILSSDDKALRKGGFTLAKRNERVLRPVTKEPLWHEPARIFPVPCYKTR